MVILAEHLGSDTFLRVRVEGVGDIVARLTGDVALHYGDEATLKATGRILGRIFKFDDKGIVS